MDFIRSCKAVFYKLWSTAASRWFRRKMIVKIVSDTERMKNRPTHVYAKTAYVTLSTK
jgi:hypothetical protein